MSYVYGGVTRGGMAGADRPETLGWPAFARHPCLAQACNRATNCVITMFGKSSSFHSTSKGKHLNLCLSKDPAATAN